MTHPRSARVALTAQADYCLISTWRRRAAIQRGETQQARSRRSGSLQPTSSEIGFRSCMHDASNSAQAPKSPQVSARSTFTCGEAMGQRRPRFISTDHSTRSTYELRAASADRSQKLQNSPTLGRPPFAQLIHGLDAGHAARPFSLSNDDLSACDDCISCGPLFVYIWTTDHMSSDFSRPGTTPSSSLLNLFLSTALALAPRLLDLTSPSDLCSHEPRRSRSSALPPTPTVPCDGSCSGHFGRSVTS